MAKRKTLEQSIYDAWTKEKVVAEPNGDRVYLRWVDLRKPESWDDWRLVGLVNKATNEVTWLGEVKPSYFAGISKAIATGEIQGRFEASPGGASIWWCRSILDGPPGDRVSDWKEKK